VDFRQNGHITDDEMHRIMVMPLQGGVRLTAIFDSCHSGTALDLPYIYSTQGILKEPNLAKEAGQGLLGVISSYTHGDLGGVATNILGFIKKATNGEDAHNRALATKTSPADVVMFSGSKDDQTSFVYPFIIVT
jgi:metacaspase-1